MGGINDVDTTAGCLESLTDLMPEEMTRRQADRLLLALMSMAHEVKMRVVDWSDGSDSSEESSEGSE